MWLLLSLALVSTCNAQLQSRFQDYDYDSFEQPSASRGISQGRTAPRTEERETTTPVPILKQINEHNEDGSYTYGYEAADGTFKLETRFQDGTVQGKYGYIDVNGEVKIIEYGANAMGFQPQGDLPEGIVIPPPVVGNCTDCDYDYDYVQRPDEEETNGLRVQNRARGGQPSRINPTTTSQNRGQNLDQPITPAPLPRRLAPQTPVRSQPSQSFSSFPQSAPTFSAAPRPSNSFSAVPAAPQPSFRPTPPPAPPAPAPAPARALPPQLAATATRSGSSSSGGFANFPVRDNPSRTRSRPAPPAARPAPAPQRSAVPSRQQPAQNLNFSRGPQRNLNAAPSGQSRQPGPAAASPLSPIRPAFEQNLPSFSSFQPAQGSGLPARPSPARAPTPVPQTSRPALTFQDPQPSAASPASLPKSALEIVDFNQLVQEFQGSRTQNFQPSGFPNTQTRFTTDNFPVRY